MTSARIRETLRSLQGLAEANRADFEARPSLVGAYRQALRSGRFRYVPDPDTCGLPDCWSTFLGLRDRYPIGPIPLDCEDIACAHAAYLLVGEGKPALVGLRPGRAIAHCVCGIEGPKGAPVTVIDPSVDCGMPPLPAYDGIEWMRVRRET